MCIIAPILKHLSSISKSAVCIRDVIPFSLFAHPTWKNAPLQFSVKKETETSRPKIRRSVSVFSHSLVRRTLIQGIRSRNGSSDDNFLRGRSGSIALHIPCYTYASGTAFRFAVVERKRRVSMQKALLKRVFFHAFDFLSACRGGSFVRNRGDIFDNKTAHHSFMNKTKRIIS